MDAKPRNEENARKAMNKKVMKNEK